MLLVNRSIQHAVWIFARGALLLLIFVAMLIAPISVAATPSQAGVSWDYRLLGPLNSSEDPETGLTIVMRGSGSFDVLQESISGGGSYTILDAGSVVGGGNWSATTFDSFTPMGPGNSPGEGGHLELEALFSGNGTGALNGTYHVVIQCSMWGSETAGPPGYPWPPDFVEAGSYTVHNPGAVMFNLNQ